ncbi:MAG TPA: signal peptidase I [Terriglobales bacterium]|nr:signal peptidase I [Terriglobales bacterium]
MSDVPPTFPAAEPAPAVSAPPEAAASAFTPSAETDLLGSLQSLSVTIVIAVFVITFLLQAFQIPSESMENTLLIGDYLLVDKVHYGHGGVWGKILPYRDIRRGDIIVFRYPVHPAQHFVKRVVGVPGDRVRLVNKRLVVNGLPLDENYVVYNSHGPDAYRDDFPSPDHAGGAVEARWWLEMRRYVRNGELLVPPGSYFVLGDNRDESLDSRYWGFVPRENIIGRPLIIYWSVRHPDADGVLSSDGTLSRFAYVLTHLSHITRWDRTFRIVK